MVFMRWHTHGETRKTHEPARFRTPAAYAIALAWACLPRGKGCRPATLACTCGKVFTSGTVVAPVRCPLPACCVTRLLTLRRLASRAPWQFGGGWPLKGCPLARTLGACSNPAAYVGETSPIRAARPLLSGSHLTCWTGKNRTP
jgi:hypothetical protein